MKNYIIFEIDKGNDTPKSPYYWRKETPSVYKLSWSWKQEERVFSYGKGGYGYGAYGSTGTATLPAPSKVIATGVGSLIIDAELYNKTSSISECDLTDKSFYFDLDDQVLYINFEDMTNPWDYIDISLGISEGYSNVPLGKNANYETRIVSMPSLKIERDSLYYGNIAFQNSSITLNNMDHYFDTFDQDDVFGKLCRVKYSDDNETYKTLYSGKMADYKLVGNNIILNLKDPRKTLETTIPIDTFNLTDYPNIEENMIGTVIPIGYNKVLDSMAYSLNEAGTTTFDFKFCNHTATSIQEIRVDGVSVTQTATDLTAGEFTLSSSDYSKGKTVTIDYTGKAISNPIGIIEDLLLTYTDTLYNDTYFNLTNWEAVKSSVTTEIGLGLIESEDLIDVIGRISQSVFGSFITGGDGRFDFKVVDNSKAITQTLYGWDFMSAPEVAHESDQYLSSAKIGYNKGLENEESPSYINTDNQDALFTKYDTKTEQEFETLLLSESDASDYSDKVLDQFGGIFPMFSLKTKMQAADLELEDLIDAQLYISDNRFYYARLEILSKVIDYIGATVMLKGRVVLYRDDLGATVTLPKDSILIRQLTKLVVPDALPNDILIQFNAIPDYIIQYDNAPDYIIQQQD